MPQPPPSNSCWVILDELFFSALTRRVGNSAVHYEGPYAWVEFEIAGEVQRILYVPHANGLYGACKLMMRRNFKNLTLILPYFHLTQTPSFPAAEELIQPVSSIEKRTIIVNESGQRRSTWEPSVRFADGKRGQLVLRETLIPLTNNSQLLNCSHDLLDALFVNPVHQVQYFPKEIQINCLGFLRGWILKEEVHGSVVTKDAECAGSIDEWLELVVFSA